MLQAASGDMTHLPEPVRIFLLVNGAQGVIDNGGYKYFFGADWPDNPPYEEFISAYEAIGCKSQAVDLRRVLATFPFAKPELHKDQRKAFIDENYDSEAYSVRGWGDALCGDKEVWRKLANYYEAHKAVFDSSVPSKLAILRVPSSDARGADWIAIAGVVCGLYLFLGQISRVAVEATWTFGIAISGIVSGVMLWLRFPGAKWLAMGMLVAISCVGFRQIMIQGLNVETAVGALLPLICTYWVGRIDYAHKSEEGDE